MRAWHPYADEWSDTYSPIGLRLIDEITGSLPIGATTATLDVQDGATWRETNIDAVRTPGGVVTYPGLGRQSSLHFVTHRYRVRLAADHYRPVYRVLQDGIEFDAPPFNDRNPPVPLTSMPMRVQLAPGPTYPFPSNIPVLRGVVVDAATLAPVPDALVELANLERVVADADGCFALPMRFTAPNTPVNIDATDKRSTPNRIGVLVNIVLPADLARSHTITIA